MTTPHDFSDDELFPADHNFCDINGIRVPFLSTYTAATRDDPSDLSIDFQIDDATVIDADDFFWYATDHRLICPAFRRRFDEDVDDGGEGKTASDRLSDNAQHLLILRVLDQDPDGLLQCATEVLR